MIFKPCTGNYTEDGTHCKGCGRSHEDIAEMRKLVGALVMYACEKEYENIEDFANGVAGSIEYTMGTAHH